MADGFDWVGDLILAVSLFAVGVATWRGYRMLRHRRFRRSCLYLGPAVALALLAEAVFGAPAIPLSWRAVVYALAVFAFGLGATERNTA